MVVRGISVCEGGVTPRVTLRSPTAIRCRSFGALVVAPFGRIGTHGMHARRGGPTRWLSSNKKCAPRIPSIHAGMRRVWACAAGGRRMNNRGCTRQRTPTGRAWITPAACSAQPTVAPQPRQRTPPGRANTRGRRPPLCVNPRAKRSRHAMCDANSAGKKFPSCNV